MSVLVLPSPKFQNQLVTSPVEVSVKFTISGCCPSTGIAVKSAAGANAAAAVSALVEIPPSERKVTFPLNGPEFVGVNVTVTDFVWPGGTLKALPNVTVKGGSVMA